MTTQSTRERFEEKTLDFVENISTMLTSKKSGIHFGLKGRVSMFSPDFIGTLFFNEKRMKEKNINLKNFKCCTLCHEINTLDFFHRKKQNKDGRDSWCKTCRNKKSNEWQQSHREYRTQYARKKREENPEIRKKNLEAVYRMIARYPEKWDARKKVRQAIKSGLLNRMPCEKCGCEHTQAHHNDYSKPLLVNWLCRIHHYDNHRKYTRLP